MSVEPISHEMLRFTQADRMRKSLHIAGISSQEMADYLDVNRNTVSRWINDEREPKRSILRLWALRTGVPLEWIEKGITPGDTPDGGPANNGVTIKYRSAWPSRRSLMAVA